MLLIGFKSYTISCPANSFIGNLDIVYDKTNKNDRIKWIDYSDCITSNSCLNSGNIYDNCECNNSFYNPQNCNECINNSDAKKLCNCSDTNASIQNCNNCNTGYVNCGNEHIKSINDDHKNPCNSKECENNNYEFPPYGTKSINCINSQYFQKCDNISNDNELTTTMGSNGICYNQCPIEKIPALCDSSNDNCTIMNYSIDNFGENSYYTCLNYENNYAKIYNNNRNFQYLIQHI